ncbi:MAG: peptide-methionine (S)-S-oxide reductase MsrA [Sedimentibacter sp.]
MKKKYIFVLLIFILLFVLAACTSKNKSSNNVSLSGEDDDLMNMNGNKVIYLAGGCFWGTEKYLSLVNGVVGTEVGYANGNTENPSYEDVCRRNTGHTETVKVVYNPKEIALGELLKLFYKVIDPVAYNRQGNDIGTQYRTGVYFVDKEDEAVIKISLDELQKQYNEPLAIENLELKNYYVAEDYHQNYLDKNTNGYCHIGQSEFDELDQAQNDIK